ncbi:MAG TPA: hypothetical protein VEW46_22845, partial [Pyrinomonadaceae bacterium]|nr:hypothetical protein [Pyrinomonadaceae bacterium]
MAAPFFWRRESALACCARTFLGESHGDLQRFNFALGQRPELSQRQVAQLDGSHPDANQFLDEVTKCFEHAAHFAFAPFVYFDLDPSVRLKFFYHTGARWRGHTVF